jgi:hypothetical protein
VILSTRMLLSRRRLFLVVALLCVLVGAFAGLLASGHEGSVGVCGVAGLGCAVAIAIALLPRLRGWQRSPRKAVRAFARFDHPSPHGAARPAALGLAALCCFRV